MKKVFIMCSGVGHINRGYESFSQELFNEFQDSTVFDWYLIKGAGSSATKEQAKPCLKRTGKLAKFLSGITGKSAYDLEQITFFLSSLFTVIKNKPAVIVYSDFILGVLYWHLRNYLKLEYKLIFSNGAPNGPPFSRCDYVQQLLPLYKEQALAAGEPEEKQFVIPYAIDTPVFSIQELKNMKKLARGKFGLENKIVIICVAAVNDSHKRISYLLEEVSGMNNSNIHLMILGQQNEESSAIIEKGKKLFGPRLIAKSVKKEELMDYYLSADFFVLPSLTEGLPRVMLEAMSFGLPVLSHDYPVSKSVLGDHGYYADFTLKGNLAKLLEEVIQIPAIVSDESGHKRMVYVGNNFTWSALHSQYQNMIQIALDAPSKS